MHFVEEFQGGANRYFEATIGLQFRLISDKCLYILLLSWSIALQRLDIDAKQYSSYAMQIYMLSRSTARVLPFSCITMWHTHTHIVHKTCLGIAIEKKAYENWAVKTGGRADGFWGQGCLVSEEMRATGDFEDMRRFDNVQLKIFDLKI